MSEPIFDIDKDVEALKKLKYKTEGEKKGQPLSKILFTTSNSLNPEPIVASFTSYTYDIIEFKIMPELSRLLNKAYKEHRIPDMLTTAADVYASLTGLYSATKLAADSSGISLEEKERLLRPIEEFINKSHHLFETVAKYYYPQNIDISPSELAGLQQDILALKEAIDKLEQRLNAVEAGAIPDWRLVEQERDRYMLYVPPRVAEYLTTSVSFADKALMKGGELLAKYFTEPLLTFFRSIKKNNQDSSEQISSLFPPSWLSEAYRQALNEIKQRYDEMMRYALKLNEDNRNFANLINDLANIYANVFTINELGQLFCLPQKYSICTADVGIISEKIAYTSQKMIESIANHYYGVIP